MSLRLENKYAEVTKNADVFLTRLVNEIDTIYTHVDLPPSISISTLVRWINVIERARLELLHVANDSWYESTNLNTFITQFNHVWAWEGAFSYVTSHILEKDDLETALCGRKSRYGG